MKKRNANAWAASILLLIAACVMHLPKNPKKWAIDDVFNSEFISSTCLGLASMLVAGKGVKVGDSDEYPPEHF